MHFAQTHFETSFVRSDTHLPFQHHENTEYNRKFFITCSSFLDSRQFVDITDSKERSDIHDRRTYQETGLESLLIINQSSSRGCTLGINR